MGVKHSDTFTDHLKRAVPDGTYLEWTKPDQYREDRIVRAYEVKSKEDGDTIISFSARPLPGCCGVIVVHFLTIHDKQTVENAQKWLDVISNAGSESGYGAMLMSLFLTSPLAKALTEAGWQSAQFTNHKSGNQLVVLTKVLTVSKRKTVANLTTGE